MASSSKSEETDNTPVHTKITWPIKKESYDLKDVIGKVDLGHSKLINKLTHIHTHTP